MPCCITFLCVVKFDLLYGKKFCICVCERSVLFFPYNAYPSFEKRVKLNMNMNEFVQR